MSIQPTDIAIFLVSFAACIYCFVLSKRLKALQNTKDGLGATITALSTSIAQMSSTTQDTRVRFFQDLGLAMPKSVTRASSTGSFAGSISAAAGPAPRRWIVRASN